MVIAKTNTRILITISKDLLEKLKAKADAENRSISNYVVTLIQKDLEKN
jgi:predicted DNA binding CopG/RHH family protein